MKYFLILKLILALCSDVVSELDVGRADPRVGSGRIGSGPHFLKFRGSDRVGSRVQWVGSGRVQSSVGRVGSQYPDPS